MISAAILLTSPALLALSGSDPWASERVAGHRAAIVETVRRMLSPAGGS